MDIGIDIGGTFTDVVCRSSDGKYTIMKLPTTRDDPCAAVLSSIQRLKDDGLIENSGILRFAHGTTVATNAVLERKGAKVGLITNRGFRDILEIGRQSRKSLYRIKLEPETPVFLAPRAFRKEVKGRMDCQGKVIEPLDETEALKIVDDLVSRGVESIAIVFLFSFLNPKHELQLERLIEQRHPDLAISISSRVDPAFREYERTVVTAFDAYIKPTVDGYLKRLKDGLNANGVGKSLQIMQSRGGLSGVFVATERPVRLFVSGPAAGVVGAVSIGALEKKDELISVDIGGTTCDLSLIEGGEPTIRQEGLIDGFPVRVSMVDVNPIGAGGGSIAWIDAAGGLRVGPRSAGSEPGPACYGLGGMSATVTDASLVLGYLNPLNFANGSIVLDVGLAIEAIRKKVAEPLGITTTQAALGIHQVVNGQIAEAIRAISVRRGYDPRHFALVALGGAGPLHVTALAEELSIEKIFIPPNPGVLSAQGLLEARLEHEVAASFNRSLNDITRADLLKAFERIDEQAKLLMKLEDIDACAITYFADVCFIGQSHYLSVPVSFEEDEPISALYRKFLEVHDRIHGYSTESPARIINIRTVHKDKKITVPNLTTIEKNKASDKMFDRLVYMPGFTTPEKIPIRQRFQLASDEELVGPMLIEQSDTTILITGDWKATVSAQLVLKLQRNRKV